VPGTGVLPLRPAPTASPGPPASWADATPAADSLLHASLLLAPPHGAPCGSSRGYACTLPRPTDRPSLPPAKPPRREPRLW